MVVDVAIGGQGVVTQDEVYESAWDGLSRGVFPPSAKPMDRSFLKLGHGFVERLEVARVPAPWQLETWGKGGCC